LILDILGRALRLLSPCFTECFIRLGGCFEVVTSFMVPDLVDFRFSPICGEHPGSVR